MLKHYKDGSGNYFGFELPEQQDLIKEDMVELTDYELNLLIHPLKTHKQLVGEAESQKSTLLSLTTNKIAPLQDAVDLDIATEDELSQLKAWKKFRVLVNRVDTSTAPDIDWPEMP